MVDRSRAVGATWRMRLNTLSLQSTVVVFCILIFAQCVRTGDVSQIAASSVTPVVYGAVTSAHLSAHQFWPLRLYAAEPRFVRLNVSVSVPARGRGEGRGRGGVVGVYGRRGLFPSHTRYDVFHAVDVDKLSTLTSSLYDRTRRQTSNVRT